MVRAIRLKLLENLSVDQFLLAFIRFHSRRSTPSFIINKGSNFTFIQPFVSKRVNIHDVKIPDTCIQWSSFTLVLTPWYGGVYERLWRVCRDKPFKGTVVGFTTLMTVFYEVEGLVKSRPSTYVSEDTTVS